MKWWSRPIDSADAGELSWFFNSHCCCGGNLRQQIRKMTRLVAGGTNSISLNLIKLFPCNRTYRRIIRVTLQVVIEPSKEWNEKYIQIFLSRFSSMRPWKTWFWHDLQFPLTIFYTSTLGMSADSDDADKSGNGITITTHEFIDSTTMPLPPPPSLLNGVLFLFHFCFFFFFFFVIYISSIFIVFAASSLLLLLSFFDSTQQSDVNEKKNVIFSEFDEISCVRTRVVISDSFQTPHSPFNSIPQWQQQQQLVAPQNEK